MVQVRRRKIKLDTGEETKPRRGLVKTILNWGFQIMVVVALAFLAVYFFGQQRTSVGPSMDPTLANGDQVLINTLVYKVFSPDRNDIIVFIPSENKNAYPYIKRVVGLPGETVQIRDGVLYINDEVYPEVIDVAAMNTGGLAAEPVLVGNDEVFVLGDSRNNSEDSRSSDIGNVKIEDIEGKAWFIISPSSKFGFLKTE